MSEEETQDPNQEEISKLEQEEKSTAAEKASESKPMNVNSAMIKLLLLAGILFAAMKWGKPLLDEIAQNSKDDGEEQAEGDSKDEDGEKQSSSNKDETGNVRVTKRDEAWLPRVEKRFEVWVQKQKDALGAKGYEINAFTIDDKGEEMLIEYSLYFDEKKHGKAKEKFEIRLEKDNHPRFILKDNQGNIEMSVYDPELVR